MKLPITGMLFIFWLSGLATASAQQVTITGIVKFAEDSTALPGVNVLIKRTKQGTSTDNNGKFELQIENTSQKTVTLVFSFIGFQRKEKTMSLNKNVQNLEIFLEAATVKGQEVVVTGMQLDPSLRLSQGYSSMPRTHQMGNYNTESYDHIEENAYQAVSDNPLSTFSIDVDAASYSNMRRMLNEGRMPVKDAIRIEEMINYFDYDYPDPAGEHPFSITLESAKAPWNTKHQLVHIGLQGERMEEQELPPSNLVFLIDVSGSMQSPRKLPLLKNAFRMLVNQLSPEDRVAIVVYAGSSGLVLPSTPATEKDSILTALHNLRAGGSTAGAAGIRLAYDVAQENFRENGNNRVILATDGDFNVGMSSDAEMVRLIEEKRETGISLTTLGFGTGNYKDSKMEKLADKGNGNYSYIDNILEAKKVLVNEVGSTLHTIVKDVKIQVEFNPAKVQAYRLIGYENRMLENKDFSDDTKDAGELGAGHSVTALYEVVPAGIEPDVEIRSVDSLKYQKAQKNMENQYSDEMLTVKLRYKQPDGEKSTLLSQSLQANPNAEVSQNLKFAAGVAGFGMLLRDSEHKGSTSYDMVLNLLQESKGKDPNGYRSELVQLVKTAQLLSGNEASDQLSSE